MAETLTQRIGRMGTGTAHAVALGGVSAVVLVVAGILAVLGVDTIEVTATLLVIPVFGVGLYLGRQPGYIAAAVATAVYMVLRRPDVGSTGVASLGLLVITRAIAYAVVVHAGAWARQTLGEAAPAGAPLADDRGLRRGPAAARSPVFVFDEDGVAEPVPAGAPGPFGGPPPGPLGPAPAPGFHAGSGAVPAVAAPLAAGGPGGPRRGNGRGVPDDDWVDEPHPSDWLVGPAALPPDDPESGPWTGPVPLPGDDPAATGGWGAPGTPAGRPGAPVPAAADPWAHPGHGGPDDDPAAWAASPAGPLDVAGPVGAAPAGPGNGDGPWGPPDNTWPPAAAVPDGTGEWPAPAADPRNGYAHAGSADGYGPQDGYGAPDGYRAADEYAADGYGGNGYDEGYGPEYQGNGYDDGYAAQGPATGGWPATAGATGGHGAVPADPAGGWQAGVPVDGAAGDPAWGAPAPGPGLTPSGRWDAVSPAEGAWPDPGPTSGQVPATGPAGATGPWDQIVPPPNGLASGLVPNPGDEGNGVPGGPANGAPVAHQPALPAIPPIDPETRLWSARFLCDRLAGEQIRADETGEAFSLVLVQVPDGPLAALSYRRQVTLLRELGHQFVAGGTVDHLVHVPDQTQHWFAVVLPGADKAEAQRFERRLRDGIGGYLRSRGLLLGELDSASLTSPDDDQAMGAIWDALIARGDAGSDRQPAFGG